MVDDINFKLNSAFLEGWTRTEHTGSEQERAGCVGCRKKAVFGVSPASVLYISMQLVTV